MITKRRRVNFFAKEDVDGYYGFQWAGDDDTPLSDVLKLWDPPEPEFNEPHEDIQDE